jgi:hypothetical protein
MAPVKNILKYIGFLGVAIMVGVSIVVLVYGSKIKNSTDLGDKDKTGKLFYAFGSMNMIVALAMLLILLIGCDNCNKIFPSNDE